MHLSADGEWQWDPESVKPGEVVLGPSFRTMTPYTATEGVRVFVDVHDGSLLCKHGELGSTIGTWLQLERAARREGRTPPPRSSICDCQSAHGLQTKQAKEANRAQATSKAEIAPATGAGEAHTSLFGHLEALNTPSILVRGQKAHQLPFTSSEHSTFLRSDGRTMCRHGRLRTSLLRMKQRGRPAHCGCQPKGLPYRTSVLVALKGKCTGRPLAVLADRNVVRPSILCREQEGTQETGAACFEK